MIRIRPSNILSSNITIDAFTNNHIDRVDGSVYSTTPHTYGTNTPYGKTGTFDYEIVLNSSPSKAISGYVALDSDGFPVARSSNMSGGGYSKNPFTDSQTNLNMFFNYTLGSNYEAIIKKTVGNKILDRAYVYPALVYNGDQTTFSFNNTLYNVFPTGGQLELNYSNSATPKLLEYNMLAENSPTFSFQKGKNLDSIHVKLSGFNNYGMNDDENFYVFGKQYSNEFSGVGYHFEEKNGCYYLKIYEPVLSLFSISADKNGGIKQPVYNFTTQKVSVPIYYSGIDYDEGNSVFVGEDVSNNTLSLPDSIYYQDTCTFGEGRAIFDYNSNSITTEAGETIFDYNSRNILNKFKYDSVVIEMDCEFTDYADEKNEVVKRYKNAEYFAQGDIFKVDTDNSQPAPINDMLFIVTNADLVDDNGRKYIHLTAIEYKPTFATCNWKTIDEIAQAGLAKQYFKVGDEKQILLNTGERVTLVILGFDHDDLDTGGKAKISIGMKNLLKTRSRMVAVNSTNAGGWDKSLMRNETMATIFSQLSLDLQKVIKVVNKKASSGNKSTEITTSKDKLWLFSEVEVDGTTANVLKNEGKQYDYWKCIKDGSVPENRIKYYADGDGSADEWWLRSADITDSKNFLHVFNNGYIYSFSGGYFASVSFGFCI